MLRLYITASTETETASRIPRRNILLLLFATSAFCLYACSAAVSNGDPDPPPARRRSFRTSTSGGPAVGAQTRRRKTLFFWKTCRPAEDGSAVLPPGEVLEKGECLCTTHHNFCLDTYGTLTLLSDVLGEGLYLWEAPGTGFFGETNRPGEYVRMQEGGKLVVRAEDGSVVWTSPGGTPGAMLRLSEEGVSTIEAADGTVEWAEYERGCRWTEPKDRNRKLKAGERLYRGQYICTKQYRFGVDEDGVVGLWKRNNADEDEASDNRDNGWLSKYGDDDTIIMDDIAYNDFENYWALEEQTLIWDSGAKKSFWVELMTLTGNLAARRRSGKTVWSSTASQANATLEILDSGEVRIVDQRDERWWWIGPYDAFDRRRMRWTGTE